MEPGYIIGRGHLIGNVFGMQAVEEFNLWARGLADVDPALSGNLQWMWKEFGKWMINWSSLHAR